MQEKNVTFSAKCVTDYAKEYAEQVSAGIRAVDPQELENARLLIQGASRIFVAGNGGSAAISDHLTCDFAKGAGLPVMNLSANPALLSALHNDLESPISVFTWQLLHWKLGLPGDLLILISSSGNSPNVGKAATFALDRKVPVIGLTGFDGGFLRTKANVPLHVHIRNYGIVEDCHQALMHILTQFIQLDQSHGPT